MTWTTEAKEGSFNEKILKNPQQFWVVVEKVQADD